MNLYIGLVVVSLGGFLVMLCGGNSNGIPTQRCKSYYDSTCQSNIYIEATMAPSFSGGLEGLYRYVKARLKASSVELKAVEGKIIVEFIVHKNGTIQVVRMVGKDKDEYTTLDKRIMDILGGTPRWIPAECSGVPVPYLDKFVIVF
jgi:hypothetical protein